MREKYLNEAGPCKDISRGFREIQKIILYGLRLSPDRKRGISLQKIVELISYNPAIYHDLYPKKCTIAGGSDAGLAIIDLDKEKVISVENLRSAQDFTLFEGIRDRGWRVCTIFRRKVIFENDKSLGQPGDGQYIKRLIKYYYWNEIGL